MNKEEFMNIQTCVLKVNIHCDGCKQKVNKILQKIEGVVTTKIDADQGKVTVSGRVDPSVLIEKLAKSGKHAEILGAPKGNNNPDQSHAPKMDQQLNPQQIRKMKGFQDMKLPLQLKDLKGSVPENKNQNQKGVKLDVPEDEDDYFSDDQFTDDDEFDDLPSLSNKMMPNNQQMMMKAQKNANLGGGHIKNGGKGVSSGDKGEPHRGGGGKDDSGGAGNQNQGGGKTGGENAGGGRPQDGKNGGECGGPNTGKKVHGGGGGPMAGGFPAGFLPMGGGGPPNMNISIGGPMGMGDSMGNIPAGLFPMGGARPSNMTMPVSGPMSMGDPMGNIPPGLFPMGDAGPSNMTMPVSGPMGMGGLMGNIRAVHGLPATGASGIPPGYFQGAGPDTIPMQQQQYLAAVMNQQQAMGSERFQPMMYARPPLAVNYMPPQVHLHQYPNPYPYPYPYPYQLHGNDQYSHEFNEENTTSSCDIM